MENKNKKIQDDEQYAILKKNGVSERIASELSQNNERIQKNVYHNYTYNELLEICRQRGITVLDKMGKNELIDIIIKKGEQ